MDGHQAGIPPHSVNREAHGQHRAPGKHRMFLQPRTQQREEQVQKQDGTKKPFPDTGKILRHPAGRHGKIVQTYQRQEQGCRLCPRIVARFCDKPDGERNTPGKPEHGIHGLCPFAVKGGKIQRVLAGVGQRSPGHHKEQRGAEIPQIDPEGQNAAEQFGRIGKIPRHCGVKVDDQNGAKRHGADQIKIKQARLFHGVPPPFLFWSKASFRLCLTARPRSLALAPTLRFPASIASSTSVRASACSCVSTVALA